MSPNQNPPNDRIPTQQWLDQELAKEGMDPKELAQIGTVEAERARRFLAAGGRAGDTYAMYTALVDAFLDARDEEYRGTKELAKEVLAMLDLQAAYFKSRRPDALAASKVAERNLREACRRIVRRPNLGTKE